MAGTTRENHPRRARHDAAELARRARARGGLLRGGFGRTASRRCRGAPGGARGGGLRLVPGRSRASAPTRLLGGGIASGGLRLCPGPPGERRGGYLSGEWPFHTGEGVSHALWRRGSDSGGVDRLVPVGRRRLWPKAPAAADCWGVEPGEARGAYRKAWTSETSMHWWPRCASGYRNSLPPTWRVSAVQSGRNRRVASGL